MRGSRTLLPLIAVLALAGCTPSPTTTYIGSNGDEVTVDWADFPGSNGIEVDDVVSAPHQEDVEGAGADIIAEITTQLEAEFDLTFSVDGEESWSSSDGNGYGGKSLLVNYSSKDFVSSSIPSSPDDWRRIVEIASEATAIAGLGKVVLDHESSQFLNDPGWQEELHERYRTEDPDQFWDWSGFAYGDGQWVGIILTDASRDDSGETAREAESRGYNPQSIGLYYGATTVDASRRAEFHAKVKPFIGLRQPPATTSD